MRQFKGIKVARGVNTTHPMFIKDGPLFGNSTIMEKKAIRRDLDLYCTYMSILLNQQIRNLLSFYTMKVSVVEGVQEILYFHIKYFEGNMTYLTYNLKEND